MPLETKPQAREAAPGRAAAAAGSDGYSDEAHLRRVLVEIAAMMGAAGACLTRHPAQEPADVLLHSHPDGDGAADAVIRVVGRIDPRGIRDGVPLWCADGAEDGGCVLLMPIDQLAGLHRLAICIPFDRASSERRAGAERLYRDRRPLAIGFFQIWQRNRMLERRDHALATALDQTTVGLVMLNRTGQIVFTNRASDEILSRADGVTRSHDLLRADNLRDGVHLQAAITHAMAGENGAGARERAPLMAFRRRTGVPLIAAVLPVAATASEPNDAAILIYIIDPELDTKRMLAPVCALYGLSPVETALVCHLAVGKSLAASAEHMHVKEQTARGYLKTIFIKTGTHRQTELIVLMLSSLVRTRRDVIQEPITMAAGSFGGSALTAS